MINLKKEDSLVGKVKREIVIPGRTEIPNLEGWGNKKWYDRWIRDFHEINKMSLPLWYEEKMNTERKLKGMFKGILKTYGKNINDVKYKPKV
jgi:hypothetical protein